VSATSDMYYMTSMFHVMNCTNIDVLLLPLTLRFLIKTKVTHVCVAMQFLLSFNKPLRHHVPGDTLISGHRPPNVEHNYRRDNTSLSMLLSLGLRWRFLPWITRAESL